MMQRMHLVSCAHLTTEAKEKPDPDDDRLHSTHVPATVAYS